MTRTLFMGLLAALLCAAPTARGALLYERSLVVDRSVNIFTTSNFNLQFDLFGGNFLQPVNPVKLFQGVTISPASVGSVFEAKPGTDPGFQDAAARLTDALNQNIQLLFKEATSGRSELRGWSESGFFVGKSTPQHPDLAGATIEAIKLRVDQFTLVFGAPSPGAVTTPPVELLLTFSVVGTVPEPSSFELAGAGLAMASVAAYTVARRRRARLIAALVPLRSRAPHHGMALRAND